LAQNSENGAIILETVIVLYTPHCHKVLQRRKFVRPRNSKSEKPHKCTFITDVLFKAQEWRNLVTLTCVKQGKDMLQKLVASNRRVVQGPAGATIVSVVSEYALFAI